MHLKILLLSVLALCSTAVNAAQSYQEFDPFDALFHLHTFPQDAEDEGKEHKWLWIVTERTHFVFEIKACHSAHIGMASRPGDTGSLHYEVVFGESIYGIKDLRTGEYKDRHEGNLLDCDNYKYFWMTWHDNYLRVGEGSILNVNEKMRYNDTTIASITRAVSVTTGKNVDGYWLIHKDMGRLHTLTVTKKPTEENKPAYDYFWLSLEEEPHAIFQAKMCTEARVNMSPTRLSNIGSLELRIGADDNTKTIVANYTTGEILQMVDTPGILSCDEYRYFWISRQDNFYEFGIGNKVGVNRVLYYEIGTAILNLAFDTMENQGGYYRFKHIEGEYYTTFTKYDNRILTEVLITTTREFFEFYVQGCNGGLVAIVTANAVVLESEYFIVIGDGGNNQVTLQKRQGSGGYELLKLVEAADILDCYVARPFWITWSDNMFRFGPGMVYKNESILEWTPTNDTLAPIQRIYLSSDDPDTSHRAEWRVGREAVSSLVRRTHGNGEYDNLWYDVSMQDFFVFQVRVSSDAKIVLTEFHGMVNYNAYELHLGALGDQKVILTKTDSGDRVERNMRQKLTYDKTVQFWVAWRKTGSNSDMVITFGDGSNPDEEVVLNYTDTSPYEVNSVSITTAEGHTGDWTFSKAEDNVLVMFMDGIAGYNYGWLALPGYWFTLEVEACSSFCMMLSGNTDYNNMANSPSIEICLGIEANTKTRVRDLSKDASNNTVTIPAYHVLKCNQFNPYWVKWTNQNVTLGQGALFEYELLTYNVAEGAVLNLRFVQFATEDLKIADVKIPHESHGLITIKTPGSDVVPVSNHHQHNPYHNHQHNQSLNHPPPPTTMAPGFRRYWMTSVTRQFVIFSVMACQEAHVALSPAFGGTWNGKSYFEISIGVDNNTMTQIKGKIHIESAITPDVLSCNEYRDFWITWQQDRVAVGHGRIPEGDLIISYTEMSDTYIVHALAFATARNYNGTWEIAEYDEDKYMMRTLPSQQWPVEIHTRERIFFFSAMVCSNAEIKLQQNNDNYYKIVLGGEGNSKVQLLKREAEMCSTTSLGYLSCGEHRNFWLSWREDTIMMGRGTELYLQTFLDCIDGDEDKFLSRISSVHLQSVGSSTAAYWGFPKHAGNATVYHSPENEDFYGLRMMTRSVSSTVFRVKTCNQARLALSDIPGIITERTLEVVIENGNCKILKGIGGEELVSHPREGLNLDCNHYRTFWISWFDYVIEVGGGTSVGNTQYLTYYLPNHLYSVNQISVSTGESVGTWQFTMFPGNVYHAHTNPEYSKNALHSQVWLANTRTFLEFAVKAEREARIALSHTPQVASKSTYEVVIGANYNQDMFIYYIDQNGHVVEAGHETMPNILDANEYRKFWVKWDNLRLTVGKGQIDSTPILTLPDSTKFDINAVSLSSGNQTNGNWVFEQDNDDSLMIQSRYNVDGSPDFSMTVLHRTFFVFQVKSSAHAEIRLASQFGNENEGYQIIIGSHNNMKSSIRPNYGSDPIYEVDTPDLLSSEVFRPFWVSWKDGLISYGQGANVHENQIQSWQDDAENLRDVVQAYLNSGDQNIGRYELVDLDGESFTVLTGEDHTYDFVRLVPTHEYFEFRVKACRDVHVALIVDDEGSPRVHYEYVFGCCENKKTVLRNESLTYNVARAETPQILHCTDIRSFWVSWNGGLLQAGWETVYNNPILKYEDPNPFTVSEISLSTWSGAPGEFKFHESMGERLSLKSRDLGSNAYRQFWRTLQGNDYFTFKVQAPRDVHVILTNVPAISDALAYEIKIGISQNTETQISKTQGTGIGDTITNSSKDILSQSEMREFWLSWEGPRVRFGKGNEIGKNEVIRLEDDEFNVNAFSLATELGVPAQWEFTGDARVEPSTSTTNSIPPSGTIHTSSTSGPTDGTAPSPTGTSTTTTTGTTTTTRPTEKAPDTGTLSAGAIVGITFGVVGFLMIVALGILLLVRLRQLKNYNEFTNEDERHSVQWDNPNYESTPSNIQLNATRDPFKTEVLQDFGEQPGY